ncbi:hypothetical protein EDI_099430 [Entamoeba dispar SAW760]|uniref:Tyrosine specific protein phosphatases domain-containing protein n=1 Tax=Entamoeba dispar (strain ATCC PRA-260 / SAW760) TaxID=370354 RepID=B0EQX0_ENTDS|nr:uncharacterized protein EDI_099430 [Entamoeba dispar SAW760]EDR23083.1 hypothetical protein EDI_099430 [Entamoeba dispar SAW760]|eukprot:EDR23083.1 hypothetical protein EDI_099430 [Entamoeba dispar SAW760]
MSQPRNEYWVGNIYNFRSIEDVKVKNGKIKPNHIFRGGFFFNKGEEDIKKLNSEKGICSLVDLRSSDEVPSGFGEMVNKCGLNFYNAPLIPFWRSIFYMIFRVPFKVMFHCAYLILSAILTLRLHLFVSAMKSTSTSLPLGWYYPVIYHYGQKELYGLFKFIAQHSDKPFIFYCSFGKDRTGLIGCMLEMLLGASLDECITDYKLSDRSLKDHLIVAKDHFKTFGGDEKGIDLAKTDSKLLIDFEHFIKKKYGTIDNYLIKFVGLTQQDIEIIRTNCLLHTE